MLVQQFLNFIRDFDLNFLAGLPPLPAAFTSTLASIHTASVSVASVTQRMGVIIPFDAIRWVIGLVPLLLAFYLATSGIQFVRKQFSR